MICVEYIGKTSPFGSRSRLSSVSTALPLSSILSTKYATIPRTYISRYTVPRITFICSEVSATKKMITATANGGTISTQLNIFSNINIKTTGINAILIILVRIRSLVNIASTRYTRLAIP